MDVPSADTLHPVTGEGTDPALRHVGGAPRSAADDDVTTGDVGVDHPDQVQGDAVTGSGAGHRLTERLHPPQA
jgi:hypothetical protein